MLAVVADEDREHEGPAPFFVIGRNAVNLGDGQHEDGGRLEEYGLSRPRSPESATRCDAGEGRRPIPRPAPLAITAARYCFSSLVTIWAGVASRIARRIRST